MLLCYAMQCDTMQQNMPNRIPNTADTTVLRAPSFHENEFSSFPHLLVKPVTASGLAHEAVLPPQLGIVTFGLSTLFESISPHCVSHC